MSNKSLVERRNTVSNRGPERWLSRSLTEDALSLRQSDHEGLAKQIGHNSITSGAEGGGSNPPAITANASLRPKAEPEVNKPDPFKALINENLPDYENRLRQMGKHNGSTYINLQDKLKNHKINVASRNLDMISRGMLAHHDSTNKDTRKWSELFPDGGKGAGTTESRFGELLSLVGSSLRDDDGGRSTFFDTIQEHIDSEYKSPIKEKWLQGARDNSQGIDNYLMSKYEGKIPEISRAAWDIEDEMGELGIKKGDNKGYSTDIALETPDGEKHQFSLKADKNSMLVNSSASKYVNYILEGALDNENNPFHEEAKQYKELEDIKAYLKKNKLNLNQENLFDYFQSIGDKSLTNKRQAEDKYDKMKIDADDVKSKIKIDLALHDIDSDEFAARDGQSLEDTFSTLLDDNAFDDMKISDFDKSNIDILKDYLTDAGFEDLDEEIINKMTTDSGLKKPTEFEKEKFKPSVSMFQGKEPKKIKALQKLDVLMKEKGISEEEALSLRPKDGLSSADKNKIKVYKNNKKEWEDKLPEAEKRKELFERYLEVQEDASDEAKSYIDFNKRVRLMIEKSGKSIPEIMKGIQDGTLTMEDFGVASRGSFNDFIGNVKYFAGNATGHEAAKSHKKGTQERQREFRKAFNKYIANNDSLRNGVLGAIKKNFPLKDVSEDLEKMIIGSDVLDKRVLKEILGTDNYDDIKEHLVVYEDDEGKSILGFNNPKEDDIEYQAEGPNGRIPISYITQRASRPGRGSNMKHDMKFHKQFNEMISGAQSALGLTEAQVIGALYRNIPAGFYRDLLERRLYRLNKNLLV